MLTQIFIFVIWVTLFAFPGYFQYDTLGTKLENTSVLVNVQILITALRVSG